MCGCNASWAPARILRPPAAKRGITSQSVETPQRTNSTAIAHGNNCRALLRCLAFAGVADPPDCGLIVTGEYTGNSDLATKEYAGEGGSCGLGVSDLATREHTRKRISRGLGVNNLATREYTDGGKGDGPPEVGVSDLARSEFTGESRGA